jgi:hypothetical protein
VFNKIIVLATLSLSLVFSSHAIAANVTINTDSTWRVSASLPSGNWQSDALYNDSNWAYATDITSKVYGGDPALTYIWNESAYTGGLQTWYRETFNLTDAVITSASLRGGVDDDAAVYVNGTMVINDMNGHANSFGPVDIAPYLHSGTNLIAVQAIDLGGGHALAIQADINTTPTPIPAAAWLFGSGLMGLAGVRRRVKK